MELTVEIGPVLHLTLTWQPVRIGPSSYGQLTAHYSSSLTSGLYLSPALKHLEYVRQDARGLISRGLLPTHAECVQEQYAAFQNQEHPLEGRLDLVSAEESDFGSSVRVFQFLTMALCQICHDVNSASDLPDENMLHHWETAAVQKVLAQYPLETLRSTP